MLAVFIGLFVKGSVLTQDFRLSAVLKKLPKQGKILEKEICQIGRTVIQAVITWI